jgi:hypothetical protein
VLYTSDCTTRAPVTVGEERVPGVDEIIRTSLREDDDELMLFTVGSSFDFLVCVFIRCFCSLFVLLLVLWQGANHPHTCSDSGGGQTAHSLFVHMFLCLLPCCPQFFLRSHCAFVFLFVVLVYCLFRFLFELFDLCFRSLFLFVLTLVLHLLSVGLNVALARQ